jgi:FkbM family methyltransferase
MNLIRFLKKCKKGLDVVFLNAKASYSQTGEDVILEYLFDSLKIKYPSYLEVGTNQPKICNNTYGFYLKGCKGVCIEPDIQMYNTIKKTRPKDTLLNIGIGLSNQDKANFYLFPGILNGWSTFLEEEANIRKKETGIEYDVLSVPLKNINDIMEKYFDITPNLISLDVEGLDLEILQSINFDKYQPDVICVETITFGYLSNTEKKIDSISDFIHAKGYFTYADTHINTIFCRKKLFSNR